MQKKHASKRLLCLLLALMMTLGLLPISAAATLDLQLKTQDGAGLTLLDITSQTVDAWPVNYQVTVPEGTQSVQIKLPSGMGVMPFFDGPPITTDGNWLTIDLADYVIPEDYYEFFPTLNSADTPYGIALLENVGYWQDVAAVVFQVGEPVPAPAVPEQDANGVYQIGTAAELAWFRDHVNAGGANAAANAALTADIDLSSICGEEIGDWAPILSYAGTFNGQGHSISNLYIGNAQVARQGLFGSTTVDGFVMKLGIKNATVKAGKRVNNFYMAALVGYNEGTISSCFVESSSVTSNSTSTASSALVCGLNNVGGIIENTYCVDSTITEANNRRRVAGICGFNYSIIRNCYAADITLTTTATYDIGPIYGGLVDGAAIENCYYLSTDDMPDTNVKATEWTEAQFKSPEAIAALGATYYTFRDGENNGYPVLTYVVQFADKTDLAALIGEAAAIIEAEDYYKENDRYDGKDTSANGFWADFLGILQNAQKINGRTGATQTQVDDAEAALTAAIGKLIPVGRINPTALREELLLSNPALEKDYTPAPWAAFAAARTAAQNILDALYDPATKEPTEYNSTTEGTAAADVPAVVAALKAAREKLYPVGSHAQYLGIIESTTATINTLKAIISRNPLNAADYTPESWGAYQAKLAAVQTAPVPGGTDLAADALATNTYKEAYTALYKAYYGELQPVGEITVSICWVDLFNLKTSRPDLLKTYKGEITLRDNYSLADALSQAGLSFQRMVGGNDHTQNVYINGAYLDNRYDATPAPAGWSPQAKRPPNLSELLLHQGDTVFILWTEQSITKYSPSMATGAADYWQYEDSLKASSFKQDDGVTVEAGQPLTLEAVQRQAAFGSGGGSAPGAGLTLYTSDVLSTRGGVVPVKNPVIDGGAPVVTDAQGRAGLTFYEEGWYLVAAYDMRADVRGDIISWPEDATPKAGTYYSLNSGALIWVHVTASTNPAAVKAGLQAKLNAVYEAYSEGYFRPQNWESLKTAYDTAAQGIIDAETIGGAYNAQQAGIIAIKAIQKSTSDENTLNLNTLRGYLARLPDDRALLSQSVAGIVDSAIASYDGLSDYQKTRLTSAEIAKCEMLTAAKAEGLPEAKAYGLSYEVKADTPEAQAAIADMIGYLQEHNTIKVWSAAPSDIRSMDFGLPGNQGKPDSDKLLQFNVNIGTQNATSAHPDSRVVVITDFGRYAYLLVREDADHVITGDAGAAWTISDESFRFSEPEGMSYKVEKNMTVRVNGTEYELTGIEYVGIDAGAVTSSTAPTFIDRSNYKGKDAVTYVNIGFPNSQKAFTMPYEDVKIILNWASVDSAADLENAKAAALAELQSTYNGLDLSKYDQAGKDALQSAKTAGEVAIGAAGTLGAVAEAKREALAKLMAVSVKAEEKPQLPEGVVLPSYGSVVGKVRVSVSNDTFPGGDFTGTFIDGWYDLCERDTMMTALLKALASEGYTWKGTGGTGGDYDYAISYLSSVERGDKKLGEFSGESGSGWMGTLNDWLVNESFMAFSVESGKLSSGDIVEIQYSQDLGEDIGGTWTNSDTSLKALQVSKGLLAPSFNGSITEYTLLIDAERISVTLTPTARNKNYLVKTFLNHYDRDSAFYKRTESLSVTDGDVIYIGVGDRSWPSMNKQGDEARAYEGTKYAIKVKRLNAATVTELIDALPDVSRITYGNYTKHAEKVAAARAAYNALSDKSGVTNYIRLTQTEARIKAYVDIDHVKTLLAAIPPVSQIALSHKSAVQAADRAYKALTEEQRIYITVGDVTNYNAAIEKLTELGAFKPGEAPSLIQGSDKAPGEEIVIAPKITAKDGTAAASVSGSDMNKAIEDAKKNDSTAIVVEPEISGKASKTTVELPKSSLTSMASDTGADLRIATPTGSVTIPNDALADLASQAGGSTITVAVEAVEAKALTAEQQKAVGDNPVFDISILSGGKTISSFGGKAITISLPYTLKAGESSEGVAIWYLDDSGKLTRMACTYDKATGLATFATDHLSAYVVGYDAWQNPFTDVKPGDWFYDAVRYAIHNEFFTGTSATTFAPNTNMTRAMLVTVLYRLEGKPAVSGTNAFTDVKAGEWYAGAVIWANANGIVTGYDSNKTFGTNDPVTREQMAAILYRYASYKKYDITKTNDLAAYTDADTVASYSLSAMKWANAENLITGRTTSTLAPSGTATRAEVATILMRLAQSVSK